MHSNRMRAASFFLAALVIVGAVLAPNASAQTSQLQIDPFHPFSGIKSPEEWEKKFIPGIPNFVVNDPYSNLTGSEFWRGTWKGQFQDGKFGNVKGKGGSGVVIRSPYPFKSAEEHYQAWLAAANGGTKKTRETLPDWSGDWQGGSDGVLRGEAKISDVMAAVSEAYKPRFEQLLRAEIAGRHWWPTEFCLPWGFGGFYSLDGPTWHLMLDQTLFLFKKDRNNNEARYIYTDGRGFLPKDSQFPQWYGASQGFWDGDELVVHTSQIKQWVMTHGLPEYSDQLEAIERFKRIGDVMLIDLTLYDPVAFAFPWHDVITLRTMKDWTLAPSTFNECVSTNNVYLDADGVLRERRAGDPDYLDFSDPRPWATAFDRAEAIEADKAKRAAGAK